MKNFNIHNINSQYINQLVKLEKSCFSSPWSYKSFSESFNNSNYNFFAATINNKVIGYIGIYQIYKQCYITNIAVYKEYRRKGVASKLLETVISFSKSSDFDFISLEVRESNIVAINLYEKLGFQKIGRRKNFYIKPQEDAFIFTLYLSK